MKKFTFTFCILAALMAGASANAQRITVTMAGDATMGFNGDGNSGVVAQLNSPYDVCSDAANNIYFTDKGNGRVRKIWASNGMVTTIAGGGTSTADNIPALQAAMTPRNMCIDAAGNIYIVDSATNRIRRIDAVTNYITTFAGSGASGFSGDGGPATAATFSGIFGICMDNTGNMYVVDRDNYRIREIAAGTGIITTIGGGALGFSGDGGPATAAAIKTPSAICVDAAHNVFFCDQTAAYVTRVRAIDAMTGYISTIAGTATGLDIFDVPLLMTTLGNVTGLCMDGHGSFYTNEISCSCRKLDMAADSTFEIAGNYGIESFADCLSSPLAYMNNPYGICIDAVGNVYSADTYNNRIRKIITVTETPSFAYGRGQLLNICTSGTTDINQKMGITNLTLGENETWNVVTGPTSGTLGGFPYTTYSRGTDSLTVPMGLTYTPTIGFTGTDKFIVQVTNGTLSDTMTLYVVVGTPVGTVTATPTAPLCPGSTGSLSENVPGGVWSASNGNVTVNPVTGAMTGAVSGSDTVFYTVSNMCGTTTASTDVVVANCALGVTTIQTSDELSIYPNPASSVLNIRWGSKVNVNRITVTDIAGRELLSNETGSSNGSGEATIDISGLAAGIYFVKVNNGTDVKKFVKE